jgi:hypothetical protein
MEILSSVTTFSINYLRILKLKQSVGVKGVAYSKRMTLNKVHSGSQPAAKLTNLQIKMTNSMSKNKRVGCSRTLKSER